MLVSDPNNSSKLMVSQISNQDDNFSKISENFMLSSSPKVLSSQLKKIVPETSSSKKQLLVSPPVNFYQPKIFGNTDTTKAQMLILDEEGVKSTHQQMSAGKESEVPRNFSRTSETDKVHLVSQLSRDSIGLK